MSIPLPSIPGYRPLRLLGAGGMARVFLALQESVGREVALKILAVPALQIDAAYAERFTREARIAAQLTHPNIVTIFDAGVHNDQYYLSMQYVPGEDLRQHRAAMTLKQNLIAIAQIARALAYAHSLGVIHRDIKPENILIDARDGRAVLTDFGISRWRDGQEQLTQTGVALGTPSYMSPEQAFGKPTNQLADIYSLGAVLYFVLTGEAPYRADSAIAIGIQHATAPVPTLPPLLRPLQPIISRCMAKVADQRYSSAEQVATALTPVIAHINDPIEQAWQQRYVAASPAATTPSTATALHRSSQPAATKASLVASLGPVTAAASKPAALPGKAPVPAMDWKTESAILLAAVGLGWVVGETTLLAETALVGDAFTLADLLQFLCFGTGLALFAKLSARLTLKLRRRRDRWQLLTGPVAALANLLVLSLAPSVLAVLLSAVLGDGATTAVRWGFVIAISANSVWLVLTVLTRGERLTRGYLKLAQKWLPSES